MAEPKSEVRDSLFAKLVLAAGTLLTFALILEFVVFRFVFLPSDIPEIVFADGVVHHRPGQSGVWRVRDEVEAPFTINAQGWNSAKPRYSLAKHPDRTRIAIIGDSYVEAMQVPPDSSFAERLESKLNESGHRAEVLRFGISGAPFSQYWHIYDRVVRAYRPDWVVVLLVHNDFDESFLNKPGRYTSSFLKLKVEDGVLRGQTVPQPYKPPSWYWLTRSAMFRYLVYRHQVRPETIRSRISSLLEFWPLQATERQTQPGRFEANTDVAKLQEVRSEIPLVADELSKRFARATREGGARLLLVMDGHRDAIYRGLGDTDALRLNKLMHDIANSLGVAFIDLHPHFSEAWSRHGERFEFLSDGHWNRRGHDLAAQVIAAHIRATARSN